MLTIWIQSGSVPAFAVVRRVKRMPVFCWRWAIASVTRCGFGRPASTA
ncbi:hypothetical protein U6N30_15135 [Blastococcus brunescens]|uniref:Uncharacterized protein n=1 Tax=Blastococcus brunescens TaxID=1564165 RepID=A0ABZ1B9H4_9ACTN|nr:hypothetical protein [Blastococcus sp. BMG 8361]WRL66608.1 hypothetical protein U6N30_15135 [Blastococcus sp. BMG 8361]